MRSLHLIDIENLLGDPWITGPVVGETYEAALVAGEHRSGDLVYVAANRWLLAELGFVAHTPCRLLVAHGEDGADLALLAQAPPEWVAARFDRLVVGSGDHIFATRASTVRDMGVLVDVVRGVGGVARDLLALDPDPVPVAAAPTFPTVSHPSATVPLAHRAKEGSCQQERAAAVALLVIGLVVVGSVESSAGASTLDQEIFDTCGEVNVAAEVKLSARDVKAMAKEFARLDDRAAKRRVAPALKEAADANARRRAVKSARAWCDDAGAFALTTLALGVATAIDVVDADPAVLTGTATPGATITARYPVGPATRSLVATADSAGVFSVTVPDLPLGDSTVTLSASAPLHYDAVPHSVRVRRSESEGAFKASTREIPADELKKDPAGLKGARVYSRGEVFQYDSRTGLTAMLVHVRVTNPGRFEFWSDPVLLRLESATQGAGIDEDDIVEFWGEVDGPYSYSTAIGGTNTVPAIKVKYIGLVEKK